MIRLVFVLLALAVVVGREYGKAEVEAFVAEDAERTTGFQLTDFKLNPNGENGPFVGTCVNEDGLQFRLEVVQEPNRISWKAVHQALTFSGSKSQ